MAPTFPSIPVREGNSYVPVGKLPPPVGACTTLVLVLLLLVWPLTGRGGVVEPHGQESTSEV